MAARGAGAAGRPRTAHVCSRRSTKTIPRRSHLRVHSSACGLGLERWPQRADGPSIHRRCHLLALAVQRETRTMPIVFAARSPSPPRRATRPAEWEDRFSPGHRVSYAEFIGIYRISHRSSFGSHGKHRRCQETQERVGFGGAMRQDRLEHNAPDWPLPAGPGPKPGLRITASYRAVKITAKPPFSP